MNTGEYIPFSTGEYKRIEIVPRGDTKNGKIPNEIFGTDRQTDRKLLKKNEPWIWGQKQQKGFEKIKQTLTESPRFAHYAKDKENIVTTDASTTGLGITLWQKQDNGIQKPIAFGSRYLNETEKKFSIGGLELLSVVWGLERFRFYLYGKKVHPDTDHQALGPLFADQSKRTKTKMKLHNLTTEIQNEQEEDQSQMIGTSENTQNVNKNEPKKKQLHRGCPKLALQNSVANLQPKYWTTKISTTGEQPEKLWK